MNTYKEIEERIETALNMTNDKGEQSEFSFRFYDDDERRHCCIFEAYSPAGEDLPIEFQFNKSECRIDELYNRIVCEVDSYANGFDPDEHVELWISKRGEDGVPSTARELVEDADAIQEMYLDLALRLKEAKNKELHEYQIIIDYEASDYITVKSFTPTDAIEIALEKHKETRKNIPDYQQAIKAMVNCIDGKFGEDHTVYFD